MKHAFLALPFVAFAAATSAQEATPSQVEALVTAAAQVGCLVTAENGEAVQAAAGLTDEEITAAIVTLFNAGQVELTPEGNARFTTGPCA